MIKPTLCALLISSTPNFNFANIPSNTTDIPVISVNIEDGFICKDSPQQYYNQITRFANSTRITQLGNTQYEFTNASIVDFENDKVLGVVFHGENEPVYFVNYERGTVTTINGEDVETEFCERKL